MMHDVAPSNYCIELPAGARRHGGRAAAPGKAPAAAHACVRHLCLWRREIGSCP